MSITTLPNGTLSLSGACLGFAYNQLLGARSLARQGFAFRGGFVLTVLFLPRWRSLARHRLLFIIPIRIGPRLRRTRFLAKRKRDDPCEITHAFLATRCLLGSLKAFLSFRLLRGQPHASVAHPVFNRWRFGADDGFAPVSQLVNLTQHLQQRSPPPLLVAMHPLPLGRIIKRSPKSQPGTSLRFALRCRRASFQVKIRLAARSVQESFMLGSSRRIAHLLGLTVCLFMTWAGLRIWDKLTYSNPVRLILLGSVSERRKAASDLKVVTEDTDVEGVMDVLVRASEDKDVDVRTAAAESLSVLVSEILRRPERTHAERERAKRRLDVATRKLTRGLFVPEPAVRASVIWGFGALGKSGKVELPPELFAALGDETSSVRQATFKALAAVQLTPAAVPTLIKALNSRDREVRFHAAELLGRLGLEAKKAVPALLATLKEPFDPQETKRSRTVAWSWDPACIAAKALGQIGASEEIVANLAEMLSSDTPERVSSAAEGLGYLGPRAGAAVPALIAAYDKVLKSKQHVIGQISIPYALGRIAPKTASAADAVAISLRALDSGDVWVRLGAAQALGSFGEDAAEAIPRLRILEQDPVKDLRVAASAAVMAIEAESVDSPARRSR